MWKKEMAPEGVSIGQYTAGIVNFLKGGTDQESIITDNKAGEKVEEMAPEGVGIGQHTAGIVSTPGPQSTQFFSQKFCVEWGPL